MEGCRRIVRIEYEVRNGIDHTGGRSQNRLVRDKSDESRERRVGGTHSVEGDIELSIISLDKVIVALGCRAFVHRIEFEDVVDLSGLEGHSGGGLETT